MIYSLFDEEIASDPLVNISVQQTSNSKKVFFTAISWLSVIIVNSIAGSFRQECSEKPCEENITHTKGKSSLLINMIVLFVHLLFCHRQTV